jgi:ABC-type uncharacterized transport system ATPase subunit
MKIELNQIHKYFGSVRANDGITLTIPSGTIQGILGENGAGKSTLMKILSGFIQQDRGTITLDGGQVQITSPSDAIRQGIGMLHQDPLDIPAMTVLENFVAGYPTGLVPDMGRARKSLEEIAAEFGFAVDPDVYVDALTVGERQQIEILRLLWLGADALILDEPTTGISAQQKSKLFAVLRRLAEEGKTVIFVSHKLEEVEDLCTHVAVLRRGKLVGATAPPYETTKLVKMMFGEELPRAEHPAMEMGRVLLELKDLALEEHRLQVTGVNLQVRAGEVIGMAGMEGSGQESLLRACAGLIRPVNGRVLVDGEDMTGRSYRAFLRKGVAYMPAARLEEGLIPGLTVSEHFLLIGEHEGAFIDSSQGRAAAERGITEFNIKGRPGTAIEALSGGNQQRALLALLRPNLRVVLMEHPTRGLDVGSALWVWSRLKDRCSRGAAIFFISSDLDEIMSYSDRILVFFGGQVSDPLDASEASLELLGELIGGKGFAASS